MNKIKNFYTWSFVLINNFIFNKITQNYYEIQ